MSADQGSNSGTDLVSNEQHHPTPKKEAAMNRNFYLDSLAQETASLAVLMLAGGRTQRPPFVFSADGAGGVGSHAATLLDALAVHQMQETAMSLAALSNPAAAVMPTQAAPADIVDVQAVEVTESGAAAEGPAK